MLETGSQGPRPHALSGEPTPLRRLSDLQRLRELLLWFVRHPFRALAKSVQVLVVQPWRYARHAGCDAEHFWRDRLARHGLSLRGPGRRAAPRQKTSLITGKCWSAFEGSAASRALSSAARL
jgi:hypothetical protein